MIWQYFSDFPPSAGPTLPPPDFNYQEQPGVGLARRTSPTNIGMALLSYIGPPPIWSWSPKNRRSL